MLDVTLTIRLILKGPILTRSTSIGAIGIDAPMARDSDGQYHFPFSLVRGRLRQSWEELSDATDDHFPSQKEMDDLLGPPPGETTNREPQRGRLRFFDFRYEGNLEDSGILHRIRIDARRGAVAKGALQVIQSPFVPGQIVYFKGQIGYLAPTQTEADHIQSLIAAGLRWITNLGAERTIGFGELLNVEIKADHLPLQVSPGAAASNAQEVLYLALLPLKPFCIAKRRVHPNLFESESVLSGGVLRGALATTLKSLCGLPRNAIIDQTLPPPWKELGAYFNDIRFTHAFPAKKDDTHRPVVPPLSLVKDMEDKIYDVALCADAILIGKPAHAPSFSVDWKNDDDVQQHFGWASPRRELTVRTAIDRDKRRAKDESLFAYEMIVPKDCLWYGEIDLRQVPRGATRVAVEAQLRAILSRGFQSIGKTKAPAKVDIQTRIDPLHFSDLQPLGDLWVVTLQTPALLFDPSRLNEESGCEELFAAYDAAWQDVSQGALKLVRFFASQSLVGGYLVLRFQSGEPYNPFLLTDQGSVFVLQASDNITSAQAIVEKWLRNGLPLPNWARSRYGTEWSTCPFLPTDGFGEIAVNLFCHKQPLKELFHDL